MQHEAVPPIPLPIPADRVWHAEFRCRATRETAPKPFMSNDYSPQKRRFSGANPISSLPAGNSADTLLPDPADPARGVTPLLEARPPSQHLEPQRQRRTEPECEAGVVGDAVIGERMYGDVETLRRAATVGVGNSSAARPPDTSRQDAVRPARHASFEPGLERSPIPRASAQPSRGSPAHNRCGRDIP
jgi:hypothetical protein